MIVTGVQMDIAWENPPENFRLVEAPVEEAVAAGAQLVVLPEMFCTGFTMKAREAAQSGAVARAFLSDLARRHGIHVLGGYAENADPRPLNSCSIFDHAGNEILHYRKIHPFSLAGEHEHYLGGDSLETVVVGDVRVTPLICYDLRFPEPFRIAAEDTDLFVVIANWPEKRSNAWRNQIRARAIENQAYVLGVNRVGDGSGEPHVGDSALIEPFGEALAEAQAEPALVTGDVDPTVVAEAREHFGFLRDRRPEVYAAIEESRAG